METSDYQAVIEAVQEAGGILCKYFGRVQPVKNKGELAVDVVTVLNMDIEQLLTERLKRAYPSIGFIGEEFGSTETSGKRYGLLIQLTALPILFEEFPFARQWLLWLIEVRLYFRPFMILCEMIFTLLRKIRAHDSMVLLL